MRVLAAFLFLFFSYLKFSAQDTIHFRNGDIKAVKVTEVGISEIKYYHFDNLDGPVRSSNKNTIWFIRYKDGFIDSIPKISIAVSKIISGKLIIKGFNLVYCEKSINDRQFLGMINECADDGNKRTLQYEFNLMRIYGRNRNNFGAVAGLALIGMLPVAIISTYLGGPAAGLASVAIMGTITISTGAFANVNKDKYRNQRLRTAQLYNSFN